MAAKFRCGHCNYRFAQKTERDPTKCPYCGKDKLLKDEGVNSILSDPELDSYDW